MNITFRWIRNHVPRCPLAAGVVCCHLALNCIAGLRAASGCFAGCGASLVDAVLDRTLGSEQFGWICLGNFVCWLFWTRSTSVWKSAYFVFWRTGAPRENGRPRDYETLVSCFV